jgi:hypothetical protein
MSEDNQSNSGVEAENPNLDFIKETVEGEINQIVRADPKLKGVFNVEVQADGNYTVKLHDGTEGQARVIEDVSKSKLLDMMEDKL